MDKGRRWRVTTGLDSALTRASMTRSEKFEERWENELDEIMRSIIEREKSRDKSIFLCSQMELKVGRGK